jgi:Ca-activated chloride channel family protein
MRFIIYTVLICATCVIHAQKASRVIIDGFVLNAKDSTAIASATIKNTMNQDIVITQSNGYFLINARNGDKITVSAKGFNNYSFIAKSNFKGRIYLQSSNPDRTYDTLISPQKYSMSKKQSASMTAHSVSAPISYGGYSTYDFSPINENGFNVVIQEPLSTFAIDVDKASYSIARHFINSGRRPPIDAVRIEEFINYFPYDYLAPENNQDIMLNTELTKCPWNKDALLLKVGLKSKKVNTNISPSNNVVLLIDISGSMDSKVKLPLAKRAFNLLLNKLREDDVVSIVTYSGSTANIVLEPISCSDRRNISQKIQELQADGATPGAPGIEAAYQLLRKNLNSKTNNRVIVATDGDFNMGINSDGEMQRMMERLRKDKIEITVLGFGLDNLKDNKLEIIADKGNGNYFHIDNVIEAKKVLVEEFRGTLLTVAKDVKAQLEFNPSFVSSYRQIGYENRGLKNSDFDDSRIDAGEMGSGHSVTALYEIILGNCASPKSKKYFLPINPISNNPNYELLTINVKYKKPENNSEYALEEIVYNTPKNILNVSDDFRFICSVAEFGMLLRESPFKGSANWKQAKELGNSGLGDDEDGYRGEYLKLLEEARYIGN